VRSGFHHRTGTSGADYSAPFAHRGRCRRMHGKRPSGSLRRLNIPSMPRARCGDRACGGSQLDETIEEVTSHRKTGASRAAA